MSTCVYCGEKKYGFGCTGPGCLNGLHLHNHDERKCVYCGSSSYGNGCLQTPTRKHKHGRGGSKCIYCGEIVGASTMGCKHNPNRKHET